MNFIGMEGVEAQLELKYCERCGGLFLRPQAAPVVYCVSCTARFVQSNFAEPPSPAPLRKNRNPRMVKGPNLHERDVQGAAQIECLLGVAALEAGS
jgi:hypothetical protein